ASTVAAIHAHADDADVVTGEFPGQRFEIGHLLAARGAPGCPDVQHGHLLTSADSHGVAIERGRSVEWRAITDVQRTKCTGLLLAPLRARHEQETGARHRREARCHRDAPPRTIPVRVTTCRAPTLFT